MRVFADQHPVVLETIVSAGLFLIATLVILVAVMPRLEGGGRPAMGATMRVAIGGTVIFAVVTFVVLRLIYSTG